MTLTSVRRRHLGWLRCLLVQSRVCQSREIGFAVLMRSILRLGTPSLHKVLEREDFRGG